MCLLYPGWRYLHQNQNKTELSTVFNFVSIDDGTDCLLRFLSPHRLAERPRRFIRSLDQDELSETIEYQRATSTMKELLRISHSIDDIESKIQQRFDEDDKRRQKRETENYMNDMIQVSALIYCIMFKN